MTNRPFLTFALCAALLVPTHSLADEVSDRLTAAMTAYEAGDLKTTSSELTAATTALSARKAALLEALLPPAPDGWTRDLSTDYAANLAMAGGGTGAEARYTDPEGTGLTITITSESPLMAMMMGMFATEQTMAMMGKVIDVGGAKMIDQDNSLLTVVDQRLMVTINGAETAKLIPLAEMIDFAALAAYDGGS